MYTLSVHMAPVGTPLKNGRTSAVGHMFYTLDNGSTGAAGEPELSGSLPLVSNAFYRQFAQGSAHVC